MNTRPQDRLIMETGASVAIPWYENEKSYAAVRDLHPAAERQNPISYDAFRAKMEHLEQKLKRDGTIPLRIPIEAIPLKRWCDANNLAICRKSVTTYIGLCLARRLRRAGDN